MSPTAEHNYLDSYMANFQIGEPTFESLSFRNNRVPKSDKTSQLLFKAK